MVLAEQQRQQEESEAGGPQVGLQRLPRLLLASAEVDAEALSGGPVAALQAEPSADR
jgi:hypothetical protein